ncbi:transposase domain-containing protein [Streptomyces yatensis]|uniref:transposase domain-containing protein n=1 Tax=Streptomyces yatensis TaxID=155177 RepID=UPI001B3C948E
MVYLALAACLFPEVGYPGVWRKLTGALVGLPLAAPTASGLALARGCRALRRHEGRPHLRGGASASNLLRAGVDRV